MFCYCEKCGYIEKRNKNQSCPVCESVLNDVPEKYLTPSKNLFLSQEARKSFVEDVIIINPSYCEALAANHENILQEKEKKHQEEINKKVQEYKETTPTYRCPVCGSSNLSAISNVGKVVKISLIGVWGAGDLGKQRRCNSCGHKF